MADIGIVLRTYLPIQQSMEHAQEAEKRGFHSVWVTESMDAKDAFTQLTAFAMKTQRILVGSGIVPIYIRTPILTGMSMLGLAELSGERAILGLGTSHPFIVEKGHGGKLDRPLATMREYIEIIQRMGMEKEFSYQGKVFNIPHYDGSARSYFESRPLHFPIYVAALRSQMIRLGATMADGVLMNMVAPQYLRTAVSTVREAAIAAGRDPKDVKVATLVGVSVSHDEEAAAESARYQIAQYPTFMPFYSHMLRDAGFDREMDAIAPDAARGDVAAAVKKIPDEMVRSLAVFGTPERCRQDLKAFQDAGADLLVLMPYIPREADPAQAIGDIIQTFATN